MGTVELTVGDLPLGTLFPDAPYNIHLLKAIAAQKAGATISPEEREAKGITPGLIRVSAGIEHPDDLQRDMLAALDRAARA